MEKKTLENKLKALNIEGVLTGINQSDFYIDYIVDFNEKVTINKILARQKDLDFLFGSTVSIEPFNGRIALRIAKNERPTVYLSDFQNDILNYSGLPIPIGLDTNGNKIIFDLKKAPHLLVGGSTGSGKSIFLNDCILLLIMSGKTELVLFDIKQVEFSIYDNISCLACPVIKDIQTAVVMLRKLCELMDNRYKSMAQHNCRDIESYQKINPQAHYITVVIDELADVLLQDKKRVEPLLIRLAQLGRACGIHLILATQRPSNDIICGLLKDNIPTRLCFSVPSSIGSRIILDKKGGENLNRNGDGLFKPIGTENLTRIQAPYISTENILKFINNLKTK